MSIEYIVNEDQKKRPSFPHAGPGHAWGGPDWDYVDVDTYKPNPTQRRYTPTKPEIKPVPQPSGLPKTTYKKDDEKKYEN